VVDNCDSCLSRVAASFIILENRLAKSIINYFQVLNWIIHIGLELSLGSLANSILRWYGTSLFLFFGTLLKEYFSQNIFLFLVGVIILNVIVSRLIKSEIAVMIAIWIFVPYSSSLTNVSRAPTYSYLNRSTWSYTNLRSQKQYSFVKSTYYWYFWLCWLFDLPILHFSSIRFSVFIWYIFILLSSSHLVIALSLTLFID